MDLKLNPAHLKTSPAPLSPAAAELGEQLAAIRLLGMLQRGLRLGLRAAWLGLAGYLLGWGANALGQVLPNPRHWLGLGLLLAALPVLGFAVSLRRKGGWVHYLDRRLGLRQQVITAWEVAQTADSRGPVSGALVREVLEDLPKVQERMLRRGWFLERDLVSAVIVLLLAAMVFSSALFRPFPPLGQAPGSNIPQPFNNNPFSQPPQEGQQPAPGQTPGEGDTPGGDQQVQPAAPQPGQEPGDSNGLSPTDQQALADALGEMGQKLSGEAPTADLGQALEDMQLGDAAQDLDDLAQRLERLDPETRERMAQAMQDAAQDLENSGQTPTLSDDLREAAEALRQQNEGGDSQPAADALQELADDLRQMQREMDRQQQNQGAGDGAGNGDGQGSGQTGQPESIERLPGEGENFELPLEESDASGLLSPAPPDAAGDGTAQGSQDANRPATDSTVTNPLVPNAYLWKWRDVVSSYFQR